MAKRSHYYHEDPKPDRPLWMTLFHKGAFWSNWALSLLSVHPL